jgi:hypothetical protein
MASVRHCGLQRATAPRVHDGLCWAPRDTIKPADVPVLASLVESPNRPRSLPTARSLGGRQKRQQATALHNGSRCSGVPRSNLECRGLPPLCSWQQVAVVGIGRGGLVHSGRGLGDCGPSRDSSDLARRLGRASAIFRAQKSPQLRGLFCLLGSVGTIWNPVLAGGLGFEPVP